MFTRIKFQNIIIGLILRSIQIGIQCRFHMVVTVLSSDNISIQKFKRISVWLYENTNYDVNVLKYQCYVISFQVISFHVVT